MSKELFIARKFSASSLEIIEKANEIATSYARQGFTMTLRQLYYQFVSRAILPNTIQSYKRLGSILNDARLAGLFDWKHMEDRTRNIVRPAAWDSPADIIAAVAASYQENPWLTQPWAPEVWVEKDALIGVIEPVCQRMRVPYFACRGNVSQSESYAAGKRLRRPESGGIPIVFHLGDHDPNGLDMTRDNQERLSMFAGRHVEVKRLALNMDQIEQYDPPPNPAKETDSRFAKYAEEFGDESWELDALEPTVIEELIQNALDEIIDFDAWNSAMTEEEEHKEALELTHERWDDVVEFLTGHPEE